MEQQLRAWVTQEIDFSSNLVLQLTRLAEYHRFYIYRFGEALVDQPAPAGGQAERWRRKLRDHSEQFDIVASLIGQVQSRQTILTSLLQGLPGRPSPSTY